MTFPVPENEEARLAALCRTQLLDTPAEPAFDRLAALAANLFHVPFAFVSLIDADRQWIKAGYGTDLRQTDRRIAFCSYAILSDDVFVLEDTTADPRFADNPLVTGPPHIRFYAGAPLRDADGFALGTLCIADVAPRPFSVDDRTNLQHLAECVGSEIALRLASLMETVQWQALEREVEERTRAEQDLRNLLTGAQCLLWHATVTRARGADGEDIFDWRVQMPDETVAQRWLPIRQWPGVAFPDCWHGAKLPEDREEIDRRGREALLTGKDRYTQEFRCRLADGRILWLAEDVRIEATGPDAWRLAGVTTDVTERRRSEENLRAVMTGAHCLLWQAHVLRESDGTLFWQTEISSETAARRLLPLTLEADEPFVIAWERHLHPDDKLRMYETAREALLNGRTGYAQEYRCCLDSGRVIWLYETARVDSLGPNRWKVTGVCTDITERKSGEEALRSSEARKAAILETSLDCIITVDQHGAILEWNPASERTFGLSRAQALGRSLADLIILPWQRAAHTPGLQRFLMTGYGPVLNRRIEVSALRADGTEFPIELSIVPLDMEETPVFTACLRDLTERTELEIERVALLAQTERLLEEAVERADRDPLTGLLNHRAFHARLDAEAERAQREGGSLAVAVLDLDNFKFFNDAYGHTVGDDVLRLIARTLESFGRPYDTLARFGGDEFALLLPGISPSAIPDIVARLEATLEPLGYCPPGYDVAIPLSLSVGVAVFPDDGPTRLDVLNRADERLRWAKAGGVMENAEHLRTLLSQSVEGFSMLDALVSAVDNKDRYTRRHSEDVLTYSLQIARELGLGEKMQYTVQVAALLHDVGKIGVPDSILRKPGGLSDYEYQAIQQHPMMGAVIVGAVPGFEETLDAIRHHHERWDGSGYPFGLRGKETPLLARLMAVADAFSAMTTDRPYRKGMDTARALSILSAGAGTQWDPECVHAFCSVLGKDCAQMSQAA